MLALDDVDASIYNKPYLLLVFLLLLFFHTIRILLVYIYIYSTYICFYKYRGFKRCQWNLRLFSPHLAGYISYFTCMFHGRLSMILQCTWSNINTLSFVDYFAWLWGFILGNTFSQGVPCSEEVKNLSPVVSRRPQFADGNHKIQPKYIREVGCGRT